MEYTYDYQKPQNTYTLEQFAACHSNTNVSYHNLSFTDNIEHISFDAYNITSDYIDEIKDMCVTVKLSDIEYELYKYRPKLLCNKIYGNGELAFIIMIINDIYSVKDFTKRRLYMPNKDNMSNIIKYLINSNRNSILKYNKNT